MRENLFFRNKKRVVPFECEGKIYRSVLTLNGNRKLFDLYVEHVPGKAAGTPPREIIERIPNAGVEEAKNRYKKSGSQAIVKSAVILTPEKQVIRASAFAEKERDAWHLFGEEASIFFRNASYRLMTNSKVYLLMPWIEGYDLQQLFSNRESAMLYGLSARVQMLDQLFSHLRLIGMAGKVFSDFKLENIMYDEQRRKIFLVDVALADSGSRPVALTSDYIEKEKIQVFRNTGVITYDWQDQMYAFGLVAVKMLTSIMSLDSDRELGRALSIMIRTIFCNANRSARPMSSQGFYEALMGAAINEAPVRVCYCNNPYGAGDRSRLFKIRHAAQMTEASEERLENRPT